MEQGECGRAAQFLLVGANNVGEAVFVGKEQPMISAAGGVLVSANNILLAITYVNVIFILIIKLTLCLIETLLKCLWQ